MENKERQSRHLEAHDSMTNQYRQNGKIRALQLGRTKLWEFLSMKFGTKIPLGIIVTGIDAGERDFILIDTEILTITRSSFLLFLDAVFTLSSGEPGLYARNENLARYVYRLKEEIKQHGITDPDFITSGSCPTILTKKTVVVIPDLLLKNADYRILQIVQRMQKETPELLLQNSEPSVLS